MEDTFGDLRAEDGVVDLCGLLRMTPFANALEGNLEGGGLRTGREVVVAEDVGDGGVEIAIYIYCAEGFGEVGLCKPVRITGTVPM